MASSRIAIQLSFGEEQADAQRLEELTSFISSDLRELGVDTIERPAGGPPPPTAKGDPITLGALVLVAAPVLLPKLMEFLQAWTQQRDGRTVKIKTPAGLEVEFSPKKRLTGSEILNLVAKLTQTTQTGLQHTEDSDEPN